MKNDAKQPDKGCLIAAASFVLLLFLLVKPILPASYTRFTADRIESLEQEYHMDLSNVTPECYRDMKLAQDITDRFTFTVSDYADFMEHDFFGSIIMCSEAEDRSYAEYKCRPYDDSRFTFLIRFQQNGAQYDAELTSYTE